MNATGARPFRLRPTVTTAAGALLLLALAAATRDGWLVLLAGCALGVLATAVILRPDLDALRIDTIVPSRASVGDDVTVRLGVTNSGRRRTPAATVVLEAPGLTGATARIPMLDADERAHVDLVVRADRRGAVTELAVLLTTAAPLGIVTVRARHAVPADLLVRPTLGTPITFPVGGDGEGATNRAVPGIDVQGVREWRHGESTTRIHARGTARHGRPLVLDRRDADADAVVILVAETLPDATIRAIAATLVAAARTGRAVGAVANQPGLAPVALGDPDSLLDWCARLAEPAPPRDEDLRIAASIVGPGGTVLVAARRRSTPPAWWAAAQRGGAAYGVALQVIEP